MKDNICRILRSIAETLATIFTIAILLSLIETGDCPTCALEILRHIECQFVLIHDNTVEGLEICCSRPQRLAFRSR